MLTVVATAAAASAALGLLAGALALANARGKPLIFGCGAAAYLRALDQVQGGDAQAKADCGCGCGGCEEGQGARVIELRPRPAVHAPVRDAA